MATVTVSFEVALEGTQVSATVHEALCKAIHEGTTFEQEWLRRNVTNITVAKDSHPIYLYAVLEKGTGDEAGQIAVSEDNNNMAFLESSLEIVFPNTHDQYHCRFITETEWTWRPRHTYNKS